jgi:hypothetical protein
MNVRGLKRDETGALAAREAGREAGREPGWITISRPAQGEQRRRLTLERQWSRKLDEVIALTAACEGISAAGDDGSAGAAVLPSRRLRDRAADAVEELGTLADAITELDGGAYLRWADHAPAPAGFRNAQATPAPET